ncbi:PqiC family protein [Gluconacetobacter takamatsuzukensis]|uniref:Membrane integrity-associated transporter subunit PqiC n=1 Tax=Gluconacetobacter takamatsuzukensis TaxID=1286190 RepID=A0A7W4KEY3_9PROT|nr:PqiC family protein [Gluconacetobacter takamatsuzukensis]MBB2205692.1 membrane integrity-associated transporter subunit PqiC [Gluconacetobacter takamatsuzukensis]
MRLSGHSSRPFASRRAVLRGAGGLLAAVAAGPLAACSSDPDFYTLVPWPGTAQAGGPAVIEVRTPSVATALDRERIVRSEGDYRLRTAGGDAWGESLPGMMGHVLTADLQQRLPGSTVFAQNDAVATTALAAVELTVTRFSRDAGGQAVLAGSLAVHWLGHDGGASDVLALTLPVSGSGTAGLVAALSALLGQVADRAAGHLRALGTVVPPA